MSSCNAPGHVEQNSSGILYVLLVYGTYCMRLGTLESPSIFLASTHESFKFCCALRWPQANASAFIVFRFE
jgi:hypothetical protein